MVLALLFLLSVKAYAGLQPHKCDVIEVERIWKQEPVYLNGRDGGGIKSTLVTTRYNCYRYKYECDRRVKVLVATVPEWDYVYAYNDGENPPVIVNPPSAIWVTIKQMDGRVMVSEREGQTWIGLRLIERDTDEASIARGLDIFEGG